jgi:hypothetical protein
MAVNWKILRNGTLLVTSVVYGVLLAIASTAGIFGIWLLLLVSLSVWRYAYALLRHVARGADAHIPAPGIETMNPVGEMMLIWHFIVFPAVIFLMVVVAPFGSSGLGVVLNLLVAGVFVVAFPASAAVMGFTGNIVAALNPASVRSVVAVMGRSYYVLVAVCAALVLAVFAARRGAASLGIAGGVWTSILGVWVILGLFALIGAALHANADEFDIPGVRVTAEARASTERLERWRADLDLAYAAFRSGHAHEGFETIRKLIDDNGRSREIQFWLFEHMFGWDQRRYALRVAARLIEQLVAEQDVPTAFELYLRCRRAGDHGLAGPTVHALASYADSIGQGGIAAELRAAQEATT